MDNLKFGIIQMHVKEHKEENIAKAEMFIKKAAIAGVNIAILPEMFNCPYGAANFPRYAEKEGGITWQALSRMAKDNNIYLVAGSIPELDNNSIYNTSYSFDSAGRQIAKHRKIHLFDIDIQGGQYFKESDTLSPGREVTVFNTPYANIGVMICYDIRFPELSRLMVQKGVEIIIVPGAFNMTTGPLHWELLFRARALDNQVFTIGVAPARDMDAEYISYGNSIIVDPWGKVINKLNVEEKLLVQEISLAEVAKVRQELPLLKHLRKDLYTVKSC